MDKKLEFNEALSALIEYATVNGNEISTETVHTYFEGILDNEEMYEAVYKYLAESKIKITDRDMSAITGSGPDFDSAVTKDSDSDNSNDNCNSNSHQGHSHSHDEPSEEEKMFLEMYMKDLSDIPAVSPEQKSLLIERGCRGDRDAFSSLIEACLPQVIAITEQYVNKGVRKSDLIQEGNLGLIEGIMSYDFEQDFDSFVENYIKRAMQDAIDEELGKHRIAKHAADRANAISDATTELAEKLGREATIEELCEYMSLSEDEIRDIMKMSLDAMSINPNEE